METILAAIVLTCSIIMIGIITRGALLKGFAKLPESTQNVSIGAMLVLLVSGPLLAISVVLR